MEGRVKKVLLLKERKITIRKAASLAGVSYVGMIDLLSRYWIDNGCTLEDLRREIIIEKM